MIDIAFSMQDLEYFLLILVRITCFVFAAPFYSMNNTPARVRVGLSFFVAILLYQVVTPSQAMEYQTVAGYAVIVLKEAVTGLLIGLAASICTSIVNFAGAIIDMEVGFAMVHLMDPTTRESSSVSGVLYQYMVMLLLMASGLHRYLISALAETYQLIPVNGAVLNMDSLLASMVQFMSDYIIIGFRICLPVFATMLILNSVLGVLAKVSPQLNMFAVGLQLKVLVGLSVMYFSVSMLPGAANFIFDQMKRMIVSFVEGMM